MELDNYISNYDVIYRVGGIRKIEKPTQYDIDYKNALDELDKMLVSNNMTLIEYEEGIRNK